MPTGASAITGATMNMALALSKAGDNYPDALDLTDATVIKSKLCGLVPTDNTSQNLPDRNVIGCGGTAGGFATKQGLGFTDTSVTFEGELKYDTGFPLFLAQFFGADAATTEITAGEGDFTHLFTKDLLENERYLTYVEQKDSQNILEYFGGFVESLSYQTDTIDQSPMTFTAVVRFSGCRVTGDAGTVNTLAGLQAVTNDSEDAVFAQCSDMLEIKFEDGSNSGGAYVLNDLDNIRGYVVNFNKTLNLIPEMTGADSSGAPVVEGSIEGDLTINYASDFDIGDVDIANWKDGDTYKVRISHTGLQIGAGSNKRFVSRFPVVEFSQIPGVDKSVEGVRPKVINFNLRASEAVVDGHVSLAPEIEMTNIQAGSYIQ